VEARLDFYVVESWGVAKSKVNVEKPRSLYYWRPSSG